jgi:hypothetical protein
MAAVFGEVSQTTRGMQHIVEQTLAGGRQLPHATTPVARL